MLKNRLVKSLIYWTILSNNVFACRLYTPCITCPELESFVNFHINSCLTPYLRFMIEEHRQILFHSWPQLLQ